MASNPSPRHLWLKREDREVEDLTVRGHKMHRGAQRGGRRSDPAVEAGAELPRRAREGRVLGDAREQLAQAAAPGRDRQQIVVGSDALEVAGLHVANHHVAAARREVFEQPAEVDPHIDGDPRIGEVAVKCHRLLAANVDIRPVELVIPVIPVIDAELALALARMPGAPDQRRQPAAELLLGRLLRIHGCPNAVLAQKQTKLKAGDARADDPNARHDDAPYGLRN